MSAVGRQQGQHKGKDTMELHTDFTIYPSWEEGIKKRHTDDLVETIRTFAHMNNLAFWDKSSAPDDHCIVVRGYFGELCNGVYVSSDDIEKEVVAWCNTVADWCDNDADEGEGDHKHKTLRLEISDISGDKGGMHIACFDKNDEIDHELYILTIREEG